MVVITIVGDYFVKKSSLSTGYSGWKQLLLGGLLYGFTAIGWFWVYRTTKFFTVGAIHAYGIIILTIVLSMVVFKEKINAWEILGLFLGLASLAILIRHGNT